MRHGEGVGGHMATFLKPLKFTFLLCLLRYVYQYVRNPRAVPFARHPAYYYYCNYYSITPALSFSPFSLAASRFSSAALRLS